MLLVPTLEPIGLKLDGFSFRLQELEVVSRVLNRRDIRYVVERYGERTGTRPGSNEAIDRFLATWRIGLDFVARFEAGLHLRFVRMGQETIAIPERTGGREFCCREIDVYGDGDGRESISADDEDDALLKCALVAGRKHWLGGVPKPGRCSGSVFQRFRRGLS